MKSTIKILCALLIGTVLSAAVCRGQTLIVLEPGPSDSGQTTARWVVQLPEGTTYQLIGRVLLVGTSDVPNPPVPPDPQPLPAGKYGVTRPIAEETGKVNASARKYTEAVARNFEIVADKIVQGDGSVQQSADILAVTLKGNQDILGDDRGHWVAWGEKLKSLLEPLYDNKKLVAPEQFAECWREIAIGIRAGAN